MLLNPKDFAKAVGIKYDTLRQHVRRKKIFKSGDFIDTEEAVNKNYIDSQTGYKGLDLTKIGSTSSPAAAAPPKPNVSKPHTSPEPKPKDTTLSEDALVYDKLDLRKKRADAEKAEKEIQLKDLEIAKRMGELMPVDMVEMMFTINLQTIFREFEQEAENIASVYCEILGGDRTHLAEMAKQMRQRLQKSIEDIKPKVAAEISAAIKDYAEVRGRGQNR